ncbi:ubiquitin carboxyl-terminal hydrolase 16 [Periophthalmus magnuspinnatus]|uniref:ubiquitin carboxyl-terminal hydrolase 16 n=1 Tax=Periophthalmus magnuspinnatus TaxID=409849 RepID=UPI00145B0FA9|nr:ubiquitin carboxyl-terminal hydrolase 16 [Periophthalmus magnuspinnatus]
MGKKRVKDRSSREDDHIDLSGPSCRHIKKGTDQAIVKKLSRNTDWTNCQDCHSEDKDNKTSQETEREESGSIWMCLKCGHRGCGRLSENKHAIKHYGTPRSHPHCLVVSLNDWAVWCYICDDEVQFSQTGFLTQLLTNLKKLTSAEPSRRLHKKVKEDVLEVEQKLDVLTLEESDEQENTGNQEQPKRKGNNRESPAKSTKPSVPEEGRGVPVKGLSNLGNTCFFNAVIQNLSQTHFLRDTLNKAIGEKITLDIQPDASCNLEPLTIHVERSGPLTLTMCQLLNEIQESKKNVVTPRDLFTQVCKKAARFKGFQQQDSQELLRYLLDGMRAEEIQRVSSGLMESLKESKKGSEGELKILVKEYEKHAFPKNVVDQVFGGEMTSTVMCQQCETVSVVKEMFLDLSLPISDEAYRKKFLKKAAQMSSNVTENERGSPVLANGTNDMPTGSKYLQKKAKKRAKKQAKQQKRQQKLDSNTTLDNLTSPQSKDDTQHDEEEKETVPHEERANGEEPSGEIMDANFEPKEQNAAENNQEEEESPPSNRFILLSDEQPNNCTLDKTSESFQDENNLEEDLDKAFIEDGEKVADESMECREEEPDEPEEPTEYMVVNQDPDLAFQTLAQRTAPEKQECSVQSCLFHFTEVETLTANNSLLCLTCTKRQQHPGIGGDSKKNVYTDALKQMLISSPPPVLTLHLKRFQQNSFSICKVNRHVQFPEVLDLAPFCAVNCKNAEEGDYQILYSLYGIVEHSGTMRSGHYTAYVKVRPKCAKSQSNGFFAQGYTESAKGSWFHISDTSVQPVCEGKVLSCQAYLLFYERIH